MYIKKVMQKPKKKMITLFVFILGSNMIPKNQGWWVKDHQIAFGKKPPEIASLVIMNDSDNTAE